MDEATSGITDQGVTDLPAGAVEDVEAHGLREVAAAAGIGAAVLSAGGVALASSSGGPSAPVPQMPSGVQTA
jgi:hypothetical protein